MRDWDYLTLEWPSESFCMLEWDMALDRKSRELFAMQAIDTPKEVMTAPYYLSDGRRIYKGFGCIYWPINVVKEYLKEGHDRFTDGLFFNWYGSPQVARNVFPQHLNT